MWQKGNATFNLDRVHGVGNNFEVEDQVSDAGDELEQIAHYRYRFGPYLEADIIESNEDMVAAVRDEVAGR